MFCILHSLFQHFSWKIGEEYKGNVRQINQLNEKQHYLLIKVRRLFQECVI